MDKYKILIVDDVSSNIHMMSLMLKDSYKIIAAKDGVKALELANRDPKPDLILLDILMPGIDGYEVCRRLKESSNTKDIPIVFVSSLNDVEEEQKALDIGGSDYIVKPVTKNVLIKKIETQIKLSCYEKKDIYKKR